MELIEHWSSETWLAEADAWIRDACERAGLRTLGPAERFATRFWSVVLTVETADGRLWFKENNPGQGFEAALSAELVAIAPASVLAPVAIDPGRDRLLTADAGPVLSARGPVSADDWHAIVSRYAKVQRTASAHRDRMLATGIPLRPASGAVAYVVEHVELLTRTPADHPLHLDADEARALLRGLPRLADAVAEVEALDIPDALEHNDLHAGNVFRAPDGGVLLHDFGNAVWGPPFASLASPMRALRRWEGDGGPPVARTVDAYLDAWSDTAPLGELRRAVPAALRVAGTHRFEALWRVFRHVPAHHAEGWREYTLDWLRSTVAPEHPLAGALPR